MKPGRIVSIALQRGDHAGEGAAIAGCILKELLDRGVETLAQQAEELAVVLEADTLMVTLGPGQHIARYLWQDLAARANFKGSLVHRGQAGASFIAVALVQKQGLFTVIPLTPGKAPDVPD